MKLKDTPGPMATQPSAGPSTEAAASDLRSEPGGASAATETGWAAISKDWANRKAKMNQEWSLLTEEDIEGIDGNRLSLLERLQVRYGWTAQESSAQIDTWVHEVGMHMRFRPGKHGADQKRYLG